MRRTEQILVDQSIPRLTLYNARSLFPKLGSFVTDMIERNSDVCCITEVWEKDDSMTQFKIDELLELRGIQ